MVRLSVVWPAYLYQLPGTSSILQYTRYLDLSSQSHLQVSGKPSSVATTSSQSDSQAEPRTSAQYRNPPLARHSIHDRLWSLLFPPVGPEIVPKRYIAKLFNGQIHELPTIRDRFRRRVPQFAVLLPRTSDRRLHCLSDSSQ